jgi:Mg-chelatase subunit ChlD
VLGKKVYINLIFFETTIDPWQKKLVPLSRFRPQALKAVKALKTRGGTNIYDTLEMAFEDKDVDTIYLLSDGAPGSGKIVDTTEILKEIRKKNRSRQIIINTISLGTSSFMRDLAEQNGGTYVEKK